MEKKDLRIVYMGTPDFADFEWKCETCSSGKFDPAGNGVASGTENI